MLKYRLSQASLFSRQRLPSRIEVWERGNQEQSLLLRSEWLRLSQYTYNDFAPLLVTRTFVGTNLNPLWEKFLVASEGR
ncbi:hypothetical protein V6N13_034219 [Hibiscus sabdariffa]|uniref:Uncharacterized protein n=1 Tax=Hibiscus sabdariffa TaxID=183260 RepID=A0ABR2F882_9ROSI